MKDNQPKTAEEIRKDIISENKKIVNCTAGMILTSADAFIEQCMEDYFDARKQPFADERVKAKTLEMQKEIEKHKDNYTALNFEFEQLEKEIEVLKDENEDLRLSNNARQEAFDILESKLSNQSKMLKDMAEALDKEKKERERYEELFYDYAIEVDELQEERKILEEQRKELLDILYAASENKPHAKHLITEALLNYKQYISK